VKKICNKCTIEKNVEYFFKNSRAEDGYNNICKECRKKVNKKYYDKNIEKIKKYRESKKNEQKTYMKIYYHNNLDNIKLYKDKNSEILLIKRKEYYEKNKKIILESAKKRNIQNKEKRQEYNKQYRGNNLDLEKRRWKEYYEKNKNELIKKSSKKTKEKRNTIILEKLKHNVRNRLLSFIKVKNIRKNGKTFDIIGCSPEFLKEHLGKQFIEDMTWENYGYYGWHIDHKIPLSSAKTEEELYKLCHFTNLQPMWALDNIKKGSKIL
jgi:hypothetical protein